MLNTGFPLSTNTSQTTFHAWRGWEGWRSSHSLGSNCNKWRSHAKLLHLACNLTFVLCFSDWNGPFSLTHNIVLSECLHACFYMVAIFSTSHLWTNICFSLILLVALCMWMNWYLCSVDVLRAWLCVILLCV